MAPTAPPATCHGATCRLPYSDCAHPRAHAHRVQTPMQSATETTQLGTGRHQSYQRLTGTLAPATRRPSHPPGVGLLRPTTSTVHKTHSVTPGRWALMPGPTPKDFTLRPDNVSPAPSTTRSASLRPDKGRDTSSWILLKPSERSGRRPPPFPQPLTECY
jgi:hypothetical protein